MGADDGAFELLSNAPHQVDGSIVGHVTQQGQARIARFSRISAMRTGGTSDEPRDRNSVQSVENAMEVLKTLARSDTPLSPAEIAQETGLTRTQVHRLLRALEKSSAVARHPGTPTYALGHLAQVLATANDHHRLWRVLAAGPMSELRARCGGETVSLYLPVNAAEFMCIEMLPASHGVRHVETLYQPIQMSLGATSSVFLAAAVQRHGWDVLPAMLMGRLSTERFDAMLRLVQSFLDRGYAVSSGLRIAGLTAIAAPVRGPFGRTVAALTVSGVDERFECEERPTWIAALLETADELSRRFAGDISGNDLSR
jgi:DNA-binding IclR family transcriptional regulator